MSVAGLTICSFSSLIKFRGPIIILERITNLKNIPGCVGILILDVDVLVVA